MENREKSNWGESREPSRREEMKERASLNMTGSLSGNREVNLKVFLKSFSF